MPHQPAVGTVEARMPRGALARCVVPARRRRHRHRRGQRRGTAPNQRGPPRKGERERESDRQYRRRRTDKAPRRIQPGDVDRHIVRRPVEPSLCDQHYDQDHDPKEYPAVENMVDASRGLDPPDFGGDHRAIGAQRIGGDGRRERRGDEDDPPRPAFETEVRGEHRIGEHRDQEIDPRTSLRHLEEAGARGDEHALDRRVEPRQMKQYDADPRRQRLEQRHQFLAERNEQQRIAKREEKRAHEVFAERSTDRALQHQDKPQLPEQADARRFAHQPDEAAARQPHGARPPPDRRQRAKLRPALLHQPTDHRHHQQAMGECRTVPPDARHIGGIAREQQQDRRRERAKRGQMPLPQRPAAQRRDRPGGHSGSPSKSPSGSSRASHP